MVYKSSIKDNAIDHIVIFEIEFDFVYCGTKF